MTAILKFRHYLLFFFLLLTLFLSPPPADAMSISQEKELAQKFMEAIKKQGKIIQDPLSMALVSRISQAITKTLPPQPFQYSFYIMNDDQFNAFAGPGANIFVNRGLITALDNVNELAGIIGHEIAHASCRHISDMVDQSKAMNIGTLAGVLAGVLIGASSDEGVGLGQAVMIGSMAAAHTMMLSYSREHETEADQKGLGYIQASGFDPKGLLTGLTKIRNRDWYGSENVPDYLKTHPGSTERIVYIQSWMDLHGGENQKGRDDAGNNGKNKGDKEKTDKTHADSYPPVQADSLSSNDKAEVNSKPPVDPFRFAMVKARLDGIYGNEDEVIKNFERILKKEPDNCTAHYGMALVLERKTRLKESLNHLRQALAAKAFDPLILIEMGRINVIAGEGEKALKIVQGLEQVPEVAIQAGFIKAQAQLMLGMPQKAETGFAKVIEQAPHIFPKAYYYMAQIKGMQQGGSTTPALSHYYLGLYYYDIRNMKSARFHLEKSMKSLSDADKKKNAQKLINDIARQKREENQTQGS